MIAITRSVSSRMGQCELTYQTRQEINIPLARIQHQNYESALEQLGCQVIRLDEQPLFPDSVFVEDCAIVLDEVAVITRPGAESRRGETDTIAKAVQAYKKLLFIKENGTLDGGDVLCLGKTIFVGVSTRSSSEGIRQLQELTKPYGYNVVPIEVRGCLHLKSAVTRVTPDCLLINPDWVDASYFPGYRHLAVDPREPHAANALFLPGGVIYSRSHPRTRERIAKLGITVLSVNVSEMEKAEGAVTCCSLLIKRDP